MSTPWFHTASLPSAGESCELETGESRHAAGARRLEPGDAIVLFDGRGGLADTIFEERTSGRAVRVRTEAVRHAPAWQPALHLAAALPKGDRQSTLVSMATQLGLASLTPLATRRSVARPGKNATDRWQRVALSACKQSRNPWMPSFEAEESPEAFTRRHANSACVVLHPDEHAIEFGALLAEVAVAQASDVALIIGPEGGFRDEEVEACIASGARCARFGSTILRTETAAVAGLAALRARPT